MRKNLPIEVKFSRRNAGDGIPYKQFFDNLPGGESFHLRFLSY